MLLNLARECLPQAPLKGLVVGNVHGVIICDELGWEIVEFYCWLLSSKISFLEKKNHSGLSYVFWLSLSLPSAEVQHILPRVAWDGWNSDGSNLLSLWSQASSPVPPHPFLKRRACNQNSPSPLWFLLLEVWGALHHIKIMYFPQYKKLALLPVTNFEMNKAALVSEHSLRHCSPVWGWDPFLHGEKQTKKGLCGQGQVCLSAKMALNTSSVVRAPFFWALECGMTPWGNWFASRPWLGPHMALGPLFLQRGRDCRWRRCWTSNPNSFKQDDQESNKKRLFWELRQMRTAWVKVTGREKYGILPQTELKEWEVKWMDGGGSVQPPRMLSHIDSSPWRVVGEGSRGVASELCHGLTLPFTLPHPLLGRCHRGSSDTSSARSPP